MRRKGESESVADKKRKSFDTPSHQSSNGNIKSCGQILAQLLKGLKRLHYLLQRTQTAHRAITWNYEARRTIKIYSQNAKCTKKEKKNEAFKGFDAHLLCDNSKHSPMRSLRSLEKVLVLMYSNLTVFTY